MDRQIFGKEMSESLLNKFPDNNFLIYSTALEIVHFLNIREFSQWSARSHKWGENGLKRQGLNLEANIELLHISIIYVILHRGGPK